ncbi:hypothetical protein CRE_13421 [Caenorhabditis remanei]|uniref:Uncharacterized protein n=1 Tax=Caenorhabditis remanei TaxID=31234 RepID=E3M893_CAERE|nr:hypothetical protein CRE_13421 [Caenorhabditis remanei]
MCNIGKLRITGGSWFSDNELQALRIYFSSTSFIFQVYVPVLQSSAGVLPIALFGASNIINSEKFVLSHLLDSVCVLLPAITIFIGCAIIVKMGTTCEFGFRRVLVTGILNLEIKRNIVKWALNYSLFCNTELSDSRNQDMVALILHFRSVEKCQKFVEGVTDIYTEQGLFAQKLEDLEGLKGLETSRKVNPVHSCNSSTSFKNGYKKGEKSIISRVIETVLLRQVNARKLVVRLFRWKIDWNLVFNAMVLLSSTASLFSTYVSTDFASKTLQHGYFFGIAYGIIGSVMGIFARLWKGDADKPTMVGVIVVPERIEGSNDIQWILHIRNSSTYN